MPSICRSLRRRAVTIGIAPKNTRARRDEQPDQNELHVKRRAVEGIGDGQDEEALAHCMARGE